MQKSRIASLDGLRAFSIALVMLGHLAGTRHFWLRHPFLAMRYADAGVRVFFVISGFLITTLLLKEREARGTIGLKEFYWRRMFRIFPAAYFYMAAVSVFFYAMLRRKDFFFAFTYLTSYQLQRPRVLGHLWSLSVEEQFYFLWPFVVRRGAKLARNIAVAAIVVCPVLRFAWLGTRIGLGRGVYFPFVADAIAMGCLLALLQPVLQKYRSFFAWRGFILIWIAVAAVPLLVLPHERTYDVIGLPLFHAGVALCMQNAMLAKYRVLNARPVVWVGTLSYSLYLWQQPFLDAYSSAWYTAFPVNVGLAFLAGTISYYAIERPALRWRDRRGEKVAPAAG